MRSCTLLITSVLLSAATYAQPNFIPDENLRNILNGGSPIVGEDGYLIDPDQVHGGFFIATDATLPPIDLTGLEYLLITSLTLDNTQGGSFGAFPAFPRFIEPEQIGGTWARLIGFDGDEIPALPENLSLLMIEQPVRIGQWTLSGFPDAIPTEVELIGFPETIPVPEVIEHFRQVTFSPWHHPVLSATVGSDVDRFHIQQAPNITTLDLSAYAPVELYMNNCELLGSLTLPTNDMAAVVLQDLPALTSIPQIPPTNEIQLLNLPSLSSLEIVDCTQNLETYSTPIGILSQWPPSLRTLSIHDAGLLDMSDLPDELEELTVYNSDLASLPDLPGSLRVIDVSYTPLSFLSDLPQSLETLRLVSNALDCMPVLPESLTSLVTDFLCVPNQPPLIPPQTLCTLLNSTCPDPNPTVSGHVYIDENDNGLQDAEEPNAANVTLSFAPTGHLTGTDQNGHFSIGLPIGQHTLTVADVMPGAAVEPASHTVDLPSLGFAADGMDFRIILPPDVGIQLYGDGAPPRPGFEHSVKFITKEITFNGTSVVTVTIDPPSQIISTSFPTVSIVDNVITAQDLQPGVPHFIQLYNAPSVPLGTSLIYTATITQPAEDQFPENNTRTLQPIVVGSYDPNDKQVFPPRLTPEEAAMDTVLEYLIRFQNTGTYLAERVVITDTLSADLRWDTFRFLESSHSCHWYVNDGVAHFVFNDIMLPDSNANEPESHGQVRFTIRPRVGMLLGESVTNIANIYFDFNEPVITDPCVLAVEVPTGIMDTAVHGTSVFPNPTNTTLTIQLQRPDRYHIEILAMDGRTVQEFGMVGSQTTISVAQLPPGAYILRSTTATLEVNHARFVKE